MALDRGLIVDPFIFIKRKLQYCKPNAKSHQSCIFIFWAIRPLFHSSPSPREPVRNCITSYFCKAILCSQMLSPECMNASVHDWMDPATVWLTWTYSWCYSNVMLCLFLLLPGPVSWTFCDWHTDLWWHWRWESFSSLEPPVKFLAQYCQEDILLPHFSLLLLLLGYCQWELLLVNPRNSEESNWYWLTDLIL